MYTPEEVAYLEQRHAAEAANQRLDFAPNGAGLRAIARKMHGRGRFSMYPKKKEP